MYLAEAEIGDGEIITSLDQPSAAAAPAAEKPGLVETLTKAATAYAPVVIEKLTKKKAPTKPAAAPFAASRFAPAPGTTPGWVMPVVIGTVAVGVIGAAAWFLTRKPATA